VRVLGVDPGLTRCGIGVVDGAPGRTLTLVDVQVIRTPPDQDHGARLLAISDAIEELIRVHRPDVLAVERVFSQHNVRSVMGTAQAAGTALVAATRAGIPVAMHTPTEVKAAVTGSGVAGKAQVGAMVARLLRLPAAPTPADASDALALAICQLWRGAAVQRRELPAADLARALDVRKRAVAAARERAAAVRPPAVRTSAPSQARA
jgi:crossover junction endodeoxyribonuclease RuvC